MLYVALTHKLAYMNGLLEKFWRKLQKQSTRVICVQAFT